MKIPKIKIPEKFSSFLSERVTDQNRYYIFAGVAVLTFFVGLLLIMMPIRTLRVLDPKIETLSRDLKQARENIKEIDEYRQQVEQLKNKFDDVLGTRILSKEEIPSILENISVLAGQCKIKVNQIMPLKESQHLVLTTDEAKYYALPILVNGRGSYHNIGRFINKIEGNKVFMAITDFDMAGNNDDWSHHSMNITIKTLVREKLEDKEE